METLDLGVLIAAALATSMLSAVVGMAGGIVLLTVMLIYFEPLVAIPLHGVVQLVSNGSRTVVQRKHVAWNLTWRYGLFLLPAAYLGLSLAQALPPDGGKALIGAFVLLATWAPNLLLMGTHPDQADPLRRFYWLGGVVGFLSVTIGATGPLIAPFFLNLGLARQGIVGTKAACQTLGHVAKIIVYGIAGFVFIDYLGPLVWLCAAVIIGTWIGSKLLDRVTDKGFVRIYRVVLTLIALRLVLDPLVSRYL